MYLLQCALEVCVYRLGCESAFFRMSLGPCFYVSVLCKYVSVFVRRVLSALADGPNLSSVVPVK